MSQENKKPLPPAPPAKKIKPDDMGTKVWNLQNPEHVMKFGNILQSYITNNNLSTKISGKDYANVDGWKFAAVSFGLTAICKKPVRIDEGKICYNLYEEYFDIVGSGANAKQVKKERIFFSGTDEKVVEQMKVKRPPSRVAMTELYTYECEADLINLKTGNKVGYGYAICSNAETKKASFDQYAIASMAQTRVAGKCIKNTIGFIMNSAGFENTPAEEMDEEKYSVKDTEPVKDKARIVPEGGIDISTQVTIDEITDREVLRKFWDENAHLHGNITFQQAMKKREAELKGGKK